MSNRKQSLFVLTALSAITLGYAVLADSILPVMKKKDPVRISIALTSGVDSDSIGPFSRDVALTDFVFAVNTPAGAVALRDTQNEVLLQLRNADDSNTVLNLTSPLVVKKGDTLHFTTNATGQMTITGVAR